MLPVIAVVVFALLMAAGAFAIGTFGRGAPPEGEQLPSVVDTPGPLADLAARTQLTDLKGCAYSPAFADDRTVMFDLTRGGEVDLWKVGTGGGARDCTSRWPAASRYCTSRCGRCSSARSGRSGVPATSRRCCGR